MPARALPSLVTPLTRKATSLPKVSSISLRVRLVSSTVSCKIPAMMVSSSIFHSSRIFMTASGWIIYGSPVLRSCPSCALVAMSMAC